MMFCAVSIAVSLVCVVTTFLLRRRWGDLKQYKQNGKQLGPGKILNLLKTNQLFPVGVSKGWLLSSLHHGHRLWTKIVYTGSANQALTLYAAYAKVAASSQVLLQLLRDVGRVGEWSPGVVSSCQTSPTVDDATGRRKPYPSVPVQHDEVTEVKQAHDNFLDHKTEEVFKRVWHREDNGCCWLLKRSELTGSWVFYLAQPAEGQSDVDHSLLTVISPESDTEDHGLGVSTLLGCLKDQLAYRKMPFTPLLSITVPPVHLLDNSMRCPSSTDEQTSNNNNSSQDNSEEEQNVLREYGKFSKTLCPPHKEKPNKIVSSGKDFSKGDNSRDQVKSQDLTIGREKSRAVSHSAPPNYVMRFEKNLSKDGQSSMSSTDEFSCSLSKVTTSSLVKQKPPIRRAESDSSLLKKPPTVNAQRDADESTDRTPKTEEERRRTKLSVLANQAAAEILIQSFKASSVDVRKVVTEEVSYQNCPGGWLFSGLDNDVVVFRRLFKRGMSTQSYMGKGLIHASPKTVWDGIRNPRIKFTYDETLKKVDILESVSEKIKIVYYYHEVLQLFRKESCDFCVMQSERVDGDKYILSLQSVDSEWAPKLPSTLRGKVLPSGWIIEPVKTNKKVISMVTFLMQVDLGPGNNGSTLPFEDLVARQPMGIVQLREYFRPLVNLAERR